MSDLQFVETNIKMPLMPFPVRSTLVPLKHGNVLISPGSKMSSDQVSSLKNVTDIVAPNLFHCAGVAKIAIAFPDAKIWGPVGAKTSKPDVKWTNELSETSWPYVDELAAIAIGGMPKFNEMVFFHKQSRSLIVSDLCFNLTDSRGFGSWIFLHLFGTYKKIGISRLFLKFVKDRTAFEKSMSKVLALDFDKIIVSHGSNVEGNGKALFLQSLKERGFKGDSVWQQKS